MCWVERRPREREGGSERAEMRGPAPTAGRPAACRRPPRDTPNHTLAGTHTHPLPLPLSHLSLPARSLTKQGHPIRQRRRRAGRPRGRRRHPVRPGRRHAHHFRGGGGREGRTARRRRPLAGRGGATEGARGGGAHRGQGGLFFFFRVKEKKRNLAEGKKSFQHTPQLARRGAPPAAHNTHTHTLTARARVRTQASPQGLRLLLRLCLSHAHTHTPLKAKKNTPGKAHTLSPLLSLFPPSTLHTTTGPVGWGCARVDAGTVAVVMGVVPPAPPATRPVAPPPP